MEQAYSRWLTHVTEPELLEPLLDWAPLSLLLPEQPAIRPKQRTSAMARDKMRIFFISKYLL